MGPCLCSWPILPKPCDIAAEIGIASSVPTSTVHHPLDIVGKAMRAQANVIISTLLGLNLFKSTLEIRLDND